MARTSRSDTRYHPLQRDDDGDDDGAADVELDALRRSSHAASSSLSDTSLALSDDDAKIGLEAGPATPGLEGEDEAGAAAMMEGVVAVWSRRSKWAFIAGLALLVMIFELDHSTTSSYETYALSEFKDLSMQGTLDVVGAILTASVKVPIAKTSDVIGRGETYCLLLLLLVASYVGHAAAPGFVSFVFASVVYLVGHAGIALLNFIVVSDVTSMRTRAFAGNLLYSPFLIITWFSGMLVERVKDGVGWRWGYGMFALITPGGAALFISTLLFLQRRARRAGFATSRKTTVRDFCSRVDLGGSLLLSTGFGLVLLPVTLAAQSHDHWQSAWVFVLIVAGVAALVAFVAYEALVARHPVVPLHYFRMRAIVVAFLVLAMDSCGHRITHTYLFAWSIAAHHFSARSALYLTSVSSMAQLLTGIVVGWVIYRARSYKWLCVCGSLVRAFGYGLMIRVRTNDSTTAELFAVQLVQGVGNGLLETSMFVAAQIMVPHAELAQVTALIALASHMGGGIGSAIAGGIYTTSMKGRLRARLGTNAVTADIDDIYDSITGTLPEWGSLERTAVAAGYSDVMGYMTIVALYVALPVIILALLMPNNTLSDGKNLRETADKTDD